MSEYEEWCPDHDGSHCRKLFELEERLEAIEARFAIYDKVYEEIESRHE